MAQLGYENSTWLSDLRAAARHGHLSHAVILTGEGDKTGAARCLAAAYLCRAEDGRPCMACNACRKAMSGIHPDVIEVRDDQHKELPVETIRAVRQDAYIRPNESERKVYLFPDCDQLNERDQNVLLKIVEEGPPYAVFLFCADTLHALLPTIRSRCTALRADQGGESSGTGDELCRLVSRGGGLALTEYLVGLENRRIKREQLQELLEDAWHTVAEALLYRSGKQGDDAVALSLSRTFDTRRLGALEALFRRLAGDCRYNVGVGQVLGGLMAELEALLTA